MPKKTFFNLEQNKQDQIINQSIKVFSMTSFNEVKIATIIKRAGIPRSSFYDYFEDKLDLYSHIMINLGEKKKKYIGESDVSGDFFNRLTMIIKSGVQFMVNEPELDAVYKQFLKDPELIKTIFGNQVSAVSDVFETMLEEGIKDGSIRPDINVIFMAKTINILTSELMYDAAFDDDKSMELIVSELVDDLLGFIKNGIGSL